VTAPAPPTLLALVPRPQLPPLEQAAEAAGLTLEAHTGTGPFLRALAAATPTAILLSLTPDAVDEALVLRVARAATTGALLLSSGRTGMGEAFLMQEAGAVALLAEPLDVPEVTERLCSLEDEGPVEPFPPPADSPEGGAPVLIGHGPAMGPLFERIARVAPTNSTVLLAGESGTGKEVVPRMLHWASPRRAGPFVAVNCAAIPEQLLESELFGHERGAFTGAVAQRAGRFERANRGTLFLDEIGDMSPLLQAKILRVLEERVVESVGSREPREVDVRVVAATHRDLRARIEEGEFREDLFYRLAVVELELPPLRDRGPDVRELALHFGGLFARRYERPVHGISRAALGRLEDYPWPGNVRELRNVLDRAVLLANGEAIRRADLRLGARAPRASSSSLPTATRGYPPDFSLEQVETDHIRKVLQAQDHHMGRSAEVLGIHRNTLTRKVRDYGLEPDPDAS
jgi:DNA-binding NtrC family response regulator